MGKIAKRRKLQSKSQSIMEYSVVISMIVTAFIAMGIYFQRSLQGRIRVHADELGEQFCPNYTAGTRSSRVTSNIRETTKNDETRVISRQSYDLRRDETVRIGEQD